MRGLPQKQNARRADKIMLCGHLRRYKKIVKKTYKFLDSKKSPETKVPGEIVISVMATIKDYSMIVATRPDPTVRPPSRIAKDNP